MPYLSPGIQRREQHQFQGRQRVEHNPQSFCDCHACLNDGIGWSLQLSFVKLCGQKAPDPSAPPRQASESHPNKPKPGLSGAQEPLRISPAGSRSTHAPQSGSNYLSFVSLHFPRTAKAVAYRYF
jgi:hypothetical protein